MNCTREPYRVWQYQEFNTSSLGPYWGSHQQFKLNIFKSHVLDFSAHRLTSPINKYIIEYQIEIIYGNFQKKIADWKELHDDISKQGQG